MRLHGNVRTCPNSRRLLVTRIEEEGWSLMVAAEAAGISERSARKWLGRWRSEGDAGLLDRSSAPKQVPSRPIRVEAAASRARIVSVIVSPLDLAVVPIAAADGGRDWLAIALGAWGAVLSTALAVSQLVRDRPGVKLRLNALSVVYEVDGEEVTRNFWELRIINHRKRPITIRRAGVFGDRQQHLIGIPFVDPNRIEDGHPVPVNPFPESLTDGTSFSLFYELDLQRDRHRVGAYVIDDFGRMYRILKPAFRPKRRLAEWRARRRFEESLGGRAALIREWRPWRWWPNRWP